jgi:hypothetical protein
VIIATNEARKPANWAWLTALSSDTIAREDQAPAEAHRSRERSLADDEVIILPSEERAAADASPDRAQPVAGAHEPGDSVEIPPALLQKVRDESVGIRNAERDAFFEMLARARDLPAGVLDRAASRTTTYGELMNDPERFRGKVVSIEGELRRFIPMPAGENERGFDALYDAWLFTDDAGRKSPYRILCSARPDGFPAGDGVRERVAFTGYFLKRCAYETAHGLHSAPLLLAREPRWLSRPGTGPQGSGYTGAAVVVALLFGACGAAAVWWYWKSDRKIRLARQQDQESSPAVPVVEVGEPADPAEFLKELSDADGSVDEGFAAATRQPTDSDPRQA